MSDNYNIILKGLGRKCRSAPVFLRPLKYRGLQSGGQGAGEGQSPCLPTGQKPKGLDYHEDRTTASLDLDFTQAMTYSWKAASAGDGALVPDFGSRA